VSLVDPPEPAISAVNHHAEEVQRQAGVDIRLMEGMRSQIVSNGFKATPNPNFTPAQNFARFSLIRDLAYAGAEHIGSRQAMIPLIKNAADQVQTRERMSKYSGTLHPKPDHTRDQD